MFKTLWSWFKKILRLDGSLPRYDVLVVEEFDKDTTTPHRLYVENRDGKNRWLHLICPCGCGDLLSINLMHSHRPYWTLTRNRDRTISLTPSIWKADGCRSHFFIRNSSIDWTGAE